MVWICLVLVALALLRVGDLNRRLRRLEAALAERPVPRGYVETPGPAASVRSPAPAEREPPPAPVGRPIPHTFEAKPTRLIPEPRPVPRPAPGFQGLELALGTRWSVWGGALLLAIGSVFLIRWGIERGLFGPEARVAAAAGFGLLLAAAGEWLRRRTHLLPRMQAGTPDIPALLTGVGSLAVFGSVYAAHALYGLIGPANAFLLLALAGAATMATSLLHGQALAGLGLIGALATPLLVSSRDPSPWTIVLFAPVVVATAHAFAWYRGWRGLAVAASAGGFTWTLLLTLDTTSPMAPPVHALLQAVLAAMTFAVVPYRADDAPGARGIADAMTGIATAILVATLMQSGMDGAFGTAWVAVGLAGVAIPAFLAATRRAFRIHAGHAALAAVGVGMAWPFFRPGSVLPYLFSEPVILHLGRIWPNLVAPTSFVVVQITLGICVAVLALKPVLRGEEIRGRAMHATAFAACALPPILLAFTWVRFKDSYSPHTAPILCVLAAILYVVPLLRLDGLVREKATPTLRYMTGGILTAMAACVCFALAFELSGNALIASLSFAAAVAARASAEYRSASLRWVVAAIGAAVAIGIASDPFLTLYGLSLTPILNGIALAYVVPAIAFAYAGHAMGWNGRQDAPVIATQGLALILGVVSAVMQIRHVTHGGTLRGEDLGLFEVSLYVMGAYGVAIGLARLSRTGNQVARIGVPVIGMLGHLAGLFLLGFAVNPVVTGWEVVGGPVLNSITAGYAFPALMALLLVKAIRRSGMPADVLAARLSALWLCFMAVNLYVRYAFHGNSMGMTIGMFEAYSDPIGQSELYAYSAAWVLMAIGFIAYGIRFASWPPRGAGFALLAATVAKVFLIDMEGLDGVHRAAAFIGLGVVLMGVGFVYQRITAERAGIAPGA